LWQNLGQLTVGDSGMGEITITGGGEVRNTHSIVGSFSGSVGEISVSGSGSEWFNGGQVFIGNLGVGTLNINDGGHVSNAGGFIGNNTGSNGTVNVADPNSQWINSGSLYVGSLGQGTLNITGGGLVQSADAALAEFSNGSGAVAVSGANSQWINSGALEVGRSGEGTLNITGGGQVRNGTGYIGTNNGGTGTANVDGANSQWINSSTLYVGQSGQGTLNITGGGLVQTSGVGYLGALPGGSSGAVTVSGANSQWILFDDLYVGFHGQGTLDISAGGRVESDHGWIAFPAGPGAVTVDGPGSQWINSSFLELAGEGGTVDITGGGLVQSFGGYLTGDFGSNGATVNVSGANSQWISSYEMGVGVSGIGTLNITAGGLVSSTEGSIGVNGTGTVNVNGANSQWIGSDVLHIGSDENFGGSTGSGTLNVSAGGQVSNTVAFLGTNVGSTGTVTVGGTGSTWTNNGALYIGGSATAAGGAGSLLVTEGGLVQVVNELKLWPSGTVTLDGGHIVTDSFDNTAGGTFNFLAGTLTIVSGVEIGVDPFPLGLTLAPHQRLISPATTTIRPLRTLKLDGGTLTTNGLVVNGAFQFDSGTFELTGGTVTGLTALTVPTNGKFLVRGVQPLRVAGSIESTITATGNLTLGNASLVNGFATAGTVNVGANTVMLLDANAVVFDSLALLTFGENGVPGTLDAANGLTLDFGSNVSGFGTLQTPDDPVTPLINNGDIVGDSLAEPITMTGYVKGVGTLDNVVITGTDAPGFSPATVYYGNVEYAGRLQIELAGVGTDSFDRIIHSGVAELGGTLDVDLLSGFMPALGETFEILTAAGGINGTFDTELLPTLSGNLVLDVVYSPTAVSLVAALPGDFNGNAQVDAADYVVWRKTGGSQAGYNTWRANFGESPGGGSVASANATVPEPASLVMVIAAFVGVSTWRLRAWKVS
jgi:T5SS/PEP-CTERM-associated repeat protein